RRSRRCRAGVQRLRIVDRSCLDHGRGLLHRHGLLDNHGRRDRLLDHDRLGDKVRVHTRPVAPVVNGRANSPGPDAANGKPRHERAAVVPPVAVVLAVPVAVDPALVIRPAGPVRPVRVAVGPARPVHIHIVDVVVDVIDREVVSGIDGTTGPVDPDVDVVRGVPRVVANTGAVDCGVPRIVADTRAIDCGVPRIVANTGAVDCGVPRIVADTRAIDRGVTRVVADAGTVDRGVTRVVAETGTVDRGVTRVVAETGTVDRGVTRVVAETGAITRGRQVRATTQAGPVSAPARRGQRCWVWSSDLGGARCWSSDLGGARCWSSGRRRPRRGGLLGPGCRCGRIERGRAIESGPGARLRARSRPCSTCPAAGPLRQSGALAQGESQNNCQRETDPLVHGCFLSGWGSWDRGWAERGFGGSLTRVISSASARTSAPWVRSADAHFIVFLLTRVRTSGAE